MTTIDYESSILDLLNSDTCDKNYTELLDYIKELKSKIAAIEAEKDEMRKMNHERLDKLLTMEKKYADLTTLLRSSLECPVCLEVPISGPFPQCKNGHLVCAKCKRSECPICRVGLFDEKSLLAVKILDNIEHICSQEGCNKLFSLDNLEKHMKVCSYRKIKCPAPSKDCGVEVPFCYLLDHILTECNGSFNKCYGGEVVMLETMPFVETFSSKLSDGDSVVKGCAYQWQERLFYTTAEIGDLFSAFNIFNLGEKSECDDVTVEITLTDNSEENTLYNFRISVKVVCQPIPVDVTENERKLNGIVVGKVQLEQIANNINNTFDVIYNIY